MNKNEIDQMEVEAYEHHGGLQKYKNLLSGFDEDAKKEARELGKEFDFAIYIPHKRKFNALCAVNCNPIIWAEIIYRENGSVYVDINAFNYVSQKAVIAFGKFAKKYATKIAEGEFDLYDH